MCQEDSIFHGIVCHSLREHPLGGKFHNGETIPLSTHLVLGDSSLGLVLGIHFHLGLHLTLGETSLRVCLVLGASMLLGVPPSLGEFILI
jgi:hypothetical protein